MKLAYNSIKVILQEKHIALNNDYTVTYSKTKLNIGLHIFLRGIFDMKAKVTDYEVFFKDTIKHIPNNIKNKFQINESQRKLGYQ